jgi:hypothetical protein
MMLLRIMTFQYSVLIEGTLFKMNKKGGFMIKPLWGYKGVR